MLGRRAAVDADRWELRARVSTGCVPARDDRGDGCRRPGDRDEGRRLPEQIEHLETGVLVEPENPSVLADWIVRLHDDPGLREKLAAAAADLVRERFTIERQADASTRRISPR